MTSVVKNESGDTVGTLTVDQKAIAIKIAKKVWDEHELTDK